jgi:endonuclease/exonuclease/phosphatase (EEP) superfamily protein YafD
LQEDFEYGDEIAAPLGVRTIVHGNGMRPDPRLVLAKILFFPFFLLFPDFSPPYGSGLTTATTLPVAPRGVVKHPYRECDGWLGGRSDCWASKGFLRVRIALADGIEVDLYNTHLDSGGDEAARATRVTQLAELAEAVERDSRDVPVVVAGDLNLEPARPGDGALLTAFRDRLGLVDTGAGPERATWRRYEHIFVRGGGGIAVATRAAGEDLAFVTGEGRPLSDHAAIYAWLALERERR